MTPKSLNVKFNDSTNNNMGRSRFNIDLLFYSSLVWISHDTCHFVGKGFRNIRIDMLVVGQLLRGKWGKVVGNVIRLVYKTCIIVVVPHLNGQQHTVIEFQRESGIIVILKTTVEPVEIYSETNIIRCDYFYIVCNNVSIYFSWIFQSHPNSLKLFH